MSFELVLARVVGVVLTACLVGLPIVVGRSGLDRFRREGKRRIRTALPELAGLGLVLGVNALVRERVPDVAWLLGWNITGYIHALEGGFVPWVQSFATPPLTAYFSFIYVYGYTFLLVFPVAAYLAHPDPRRLRELVVAYGFNYVLGLICYALFVAYGPRNLLTGQVESLLFTTYPEFQLLTSQVNTNTNVFPSLHTSLSVTVAMFAYRTRATYPLWTAAATVLAGSVVVSTMYLGIHWLTDVIAGAALAWVCVALAERLPLDSGDSWRAALSRDGPDDDPNEPNDPGRL